MGELKDRVTVLTKQGFSAIVYSGGSRKAVYARTVGLIFRWAMFPDYGFFMQETI